MNEQRELFVQAKSSTFLNLLICTLPLNKKHTGTICEKRKKFVPMESNVIPQDYETVSNQEL
jgi:hypothetical protein